MHYSKLALIATFAAGALADPARSGNTNKGGAKAATASAAANTAASGTTGGNGASLSLDPAAVQSGSFVDGSTSIGAEAGQAKSQISQNNFINFCAGKTLTNGLQIVGGSCNGIVMGDIPAKTKMVSSIITFPQTGTQIASDTDFTVTVQMSNLVAGSFTDADATYYAGPQFLQNGVVVGHTHVTIQDLGKTLNPKVAPDPTQFAFFKGINDAGNGQGLLSANVTGGLPAGNYRICTMASASNHQPVLMPVAQRGTPDDCTKFVVTGNGKTINAASNNGAKGQAAAALVSDAVVGATNSAFAASVIASESAAAAAKAAATATGATAAQGTAAQTGGKGSKAKGNKNANAISVAGTATDTAAAIAATATDSATATAQTGGKGSKAKGNKNANANSVAATATDTTATDAALATGTDTIATDAASATATDTATATQTAASKGRGGRKGSFRHRFGGRDNKLRFAKREFVA